MRSGRLAAWLPLAMALLGDPAGAQSILAQPLPPPDAPAPPAVSSRRPPARPPMPVRPPTPVRPSPPVRHVPVVRPAHAPVKKPPHHPPAKSVAKPPAHVAPKAAPAPAPAAAAPPAPAFDPYKGTVTGLPLPRWAAFRSDDVNLRSGPGTQYPIDWVYHRRDLPVQILREFEVWRLVAEQDGTKGWVHEATLTGRRGYVVQGGEQVLRTDPSATATAVARVEPGVVGHIRRCPVASDWCDVEAGAYHGWLPRSALYGVSAGEAIQ